MSHACFVLIGVSLPSLFLVGPEIGNELLATGSLLSLLIGQAKTNVPLCNPSAPSSVWEIGTKWEEDQCWWRRGWATSATVLLCFLWTRCQWRGGLVAAGQVLLHHSISCQPHLLCLLSHGRPSNVLSQAITSSPKARPVSWGRWLLEVASSPS